MSEPVKYKAPQLVRVLFLLMGIVFIVLGVVEIVQWFASPAGDVMRVPFLLFGIPALFVGLAGLWGFWWSRKPRA